MTHSYLCDLSSFKLIAVSGEKAAIFLQGQLTCDIREIHANQTRRGAHCSPKGRILSTFRVLQFQENFYLLIPEIMSDLAIEQLKKYAVFSKVRLMQDDSLKIIGCVGKEMALTLATLFDGLPEKPDQAATYFKDTKNLICVCVENETPRFEIIGDIASIVWLQETFLQKYPTKTADSWRLIDIDLGIATIYPNTRDLFTPQMLNYPALNAVSFKKGCYTGQEVIARTHYLGKAKRHLHKLSLKNGELPKAGDALYNKTNQVIGTVIDAVFKTPGESQVLAVLQDDAVSEGLYWQNSEMTLCVLSSAPALRRE